MKMKVLSKLTKKTRAPEEKLKKFKTGFICGTGSPVNRNEKIPHF